jgi:hypothetical protein
MVDSFWNSTGQRDWSDTGDDVQRLDDDDDATEGIPFAQNVPDSEQD